MSDFLDNLNENSGAINVYAQYGALRQRSDLLARQREQTAAIQEQTRQLEKQASIERDRTSLEKQRLAIEQKRLVAEESEREHRRLEAEQIKQARVIMADCFDSLERLMTLRPAT